MKPSDFEIRKAKIEDGHIDYWFNIGGETADELAKAHMEQSMICVSGCVYSVDEDVLGIDRKRWRFTTSMSLIIQTCTTR